MFTKSARRAARHLSNRSLSRARFLQFESLEDRRVLDGNLSVVDFYWIDGYQDPLDAPAVGSRTFAQVELSESGMSASDTYRVEFLLDNISVSTATISPSTGFDFDTIMSPADWLITPGPHTLSVMLDPDNDVAEYDESDNFRSFEWQDL
jgi:hypothetical protein